MLRRFLPALALVAALTAPIRAQVDCPTTLGPGQALSDRFSGDPGIDHERAQTFVAEHAGRIVGFEIYGGYTYANNGPDGVILVDVRPTVHGVPANSAASALSSATYERSAMGTSAGWFRFQLPGAGVPVAPGDTLAITVRVTGGFYVSWQGTIGDLPVDFYPGGKAYTKIAGTLGWRSFDDLEPWGAIRGTIDYAFRIVTCEEAVAASPTTWGALKSRYR